MTENVLQASITTAAATTTTTTTVAATLNVSTVAEATTEVKTPEKINSIQKHSLLFHISPRLFRNKRLKRKRLKWARIIKNLKDKPRKKTDRFKKRTFNLTADVTINLVSDDESNDVQNKSNFITKAKGKNNNKNYAYNNNHSRKNKNNNNNNCRVAANNFQQLYVYTGMPVELSKTPNITLEPVLKNNFQHLSGLEQQRNKKRKRKSQQPKRVHSQPVLMNNESIVLSDEEEEQTPNFHFNHLQGENKSPLKTAVSVNQNHSNLMHLPVKTLAVDEEVTVSLVPRSSAAGTGACSNSNENSPFPMLPDETTVHTVIANRIYELSLAKLREGLASCSTPEYSGDQQQNLSPSQRRKCKSSTPNPITPPQAPISLKLSSDLSISLISDDDEEEHSKQILQAEKILQQHPQLSVQHLQFPPAAVTVVHRREKLG